MGEWFFPNHRRLAETAFADGVGSYNGSDNPVGAHPVGEWFFPTAGAWPKPRSPTVSAPTTVPITPWANGFPNHRRLAETAFADSVGSCKVSITPCDFVSARSRG